LTKQISTQEVLHFQWSLQLLGEEDNVHVSPVKERQQKWEARKSPSGGMICAFAFPKL